MALPFRKISQDQLAAVMERYPFARRIDSIVWLQSGRPDRAGFAGADTLAELWRRDTGRGEPDVTWHLAVDPTGGAWLGRDWNLPASLGSGGAFVVLLIGDFSAGADPLDGPQRETALQAAALVWSKSPAVLEERVPDRPVADDEEVPFTVLDAIERATEAAEGIGPQASEPAAAVVLESVATVDISFGPNAKAAGVTGFSRGVLTDILQAAGLPRVTISSTSRLPADQARVMFINLEQQGIDAQLRLYKEPGRKVIEVYRQGKLAGKDAASIQAAMTAEIVRLGPTTVSRHASDPKILNVFDVAPSSVTDRPAFEAAVRDEPRVTKFLLPPNDPGYHLEIPQPGQTGSP